MDEWDASFAELRRMFGVTQQENARLDSEVTSLSRQVQSLSEQLRRLSNG
ncbi:MbeD family mobilization/exclusion protein [Salmonella enterica subsp. enterica serovar Typhimurium]|nr:MbeD family mobilization/exclusion protein [Salmonella enterica subsp. enterica serovar Typhimurium]